MPKDVLHVDTLSMLVPAVFPAATRFSDVIAIRGGLESAVASLTVHERGLPRRVIVKRLPRETRSEAERHRFFSSAGMTAPLLGVVDHEDDTYLLLEHVHSVADWPWSDPARVRLVLERLAELHRIGGASVAVETWDYEQELHDCAAEAVTTMELTAPALPELDLRRRVRSVRRVASSLTRMRSRLLDAFGTTVIHGDLHSGNVILRHHEERDDVVFLDWGRSRRGSVLEDVSSWLLSLRSWEPVVVRHHDALLRAYLDAAGLPSNVDAPLRDAYWFAAASNVLAGALRYQLLRAAESEGSERATAVAQAHAALRAVRRADERLQSS